MLAEPPNPQVWSRSKMFPLKRACIALAGIALVACGNDRSVNPIAEIADGSVAAITSGGTLVAQYSLLVGQSVKINPKTTTRTNRLRWSTSNSNAASVSSQGTVTARASGSATVQVSGTGVLENYAITVTAPVAPTVTSFSLQPKTGVSLTAGQSQQFAASASWSDGMQYPITVSYSATGGTISGTGLFTAGNLAGTFMVVATCACTTPAIADTALVSVVVPQLTSLTVSPKTASVAAGATQQFGVSATWSTGATTLPPVTWSATGGTVSASGLYTAPTVAGTYRVIVAHSNGAVRDTATVNVTGGSATPPNSSFTPMLPAGMTLITDTNFGNLGVLGEFNSDSVRYFWDSRQGRDDTAPYSSGVYETFYPGNDAGNGAGGGLLLGPDGKKWRKVYFAAMVWVQSNYSIHSNGEKFFYPRITTPGQVEQSTSMGWAPQGSDTPNGPTFGFQLYTQAIGGTTRWDPVPNYVRVTKGRWTRIEVYMAMNTVGRSDGIWQVWVDGVLAADLRNVPYSNATAESYFDGIRFTGTRGGGASNTLTPPEGQLRRYDRLAFYASAN